MTIYLIRHAHAGSRSRWDQPDELRPLSARGHDQAAAIAVQLADQAIEALWTSPYLRCRQTLAPLSARLGVEVEDRMELVEGTDGPVALDAVLAGATAGRSIAVCSHGDVLPALVAAAVRRGALLSGDRLLAKGGRYDATMANGQLAQIVSVGAPDEAPTEDPAPLT